MNKTQRREWRVYVFGCTDLTVAQRFVLLALETFADYPSGENARPGVTRLAEMCGLKPSAVEKALARGRDLKLIEQTARANPKRHLAAVHRLVSTRIAVRVEDDFNPYETDFNPYENEFQPVRDDVSTRTHVQPTNPITPIPLNTNPKITEREGADSVDPHLALVESHGQETANSKDDPEPNEFCRKHMPYGTEDNCGPCMRARLKYEAWEDRYWAKQEANRVPGTFDDPPSRHDPARCGLCDDQGWMLDATGVPHDPAIKCTWPTPETA